MKSLACFVLVVLTGASTRAGEANAPAPSADYELRVQNRPVVQRGFMPDSSARSIAVGLPGGLSYCFDAESCRLRYAWSGEFLNMKPTWHGRGAQPPELRGAKFFDAPDTDMPLLRLGDKTTPPKIKFLGFALVNKLPEFRFTVDDIAVKQRIAGAAGGGLRCAFELGNATNDVFFHAPEGVRVSGAGRYLAGDDKGWVKIPRGSPTQFEALIPGLPQAKPSPTAAISTER